MILWVDDELFGGQSRDVDRLALLRNAALRRHTVIISASPQALSDSRQAPMFEFWLSTLSPRLQAEVWLLRERTRLVTANAIAVGANRVLVAERRPDADGCWLSLDEAARAAAEPLQVMVEHQINDAAFLRRAMPPVWRKRFEDWEGKGEIRYANGGGLSVMTALVTFFTDDNTARRCFGLPAEVWRLLHFLVFDHDGERPETPGDQSKELDRRCKSNGMIRRIHRLVRRDQEHYLPLEALRSISNARVQDTVERDTLLDKLEKHFALGQARHFVPLPRIGNDPFFKSEFVQEIAWSDDWFERDDAWPEMTQLAERIASAI